MMDILGASQVLGNDFRLLVSDPLHLSGETAAVGPVNPEQGFGELLLRAIDSVNTQQVDAMDLAQAMITTPDEVNVHDVTIALANANLSLSLAKAVLDRGIQAYREIISIR